MNWHIIGFGLSLVVGVVLFVVTVCGVIGGFMYFMSTDRRRALRILTNNLISTMPDFFTKEIKKWK